MSNVFIWAETWYRRPTWFKLLVWVVTISVLWVFPLSLDIRLILVFMFTATVFALIGDQRAGYGLFGPLVCGVGAVTLYIAILMVTSMPTIFAKMLYILDMAAR
jgi:hypothetical protein